MNIVDHINIRQVALTNPPFFYHSPCCLWEHLALDEVVQRPIQQTGILNILLNNLEFVCWWWFGRLGGKGRKGTKELFFTRCHEEEGERRIDLEDLCAWGRREDGRKDSKESIALLSTCFYFSASNSLYGGFYLKPRTLSDLQVSFLILFSSFLY